MAKRSFLGGLKSKAKVVGDKTSAISQRAKGVVSEEKVSEATKNLLNLVSRLARDARNNLDPDMVKAIDIRANVSFVAFSVGVVVDLEKLQPKKRARNVAKIIDLEGIGPTYAQKLNSADVKTTEDLLEAGATRRGREELAAQTGISGTLILEWVNLADLLRIKGVGEEYSDLLEEAGVDTVAELARRNAVNLHAKICEVNEEKQLVRRPPTLGAVTDWINQAKNLLRIVEY
jgi:predicted flap endonuclease-1-like 5' DNA nuclease